MIQRNGFFRETTLGWVRYSEGVLNYVRTLDPETRMGERGSRDRQHEPVAFARCFFLLLIPLVWTDLGQAFLVLLGKGGWSIWLFLPSGWHLWLLKSFASYRGIAHTHEGREGSAE